MRSTDRNGLVERTFEPLPLGAIKPKGWLERQLRLQVDGLTGHLDDIWPDLADNQWLGGSNGGWERAPYYVDGLVPLAYLLNDEKLTEKAEKWIVNAFLEGQNETGWIGPENPATWQGSDHDPWPRFIVLKALTQYYEATDDDRVLDVMTGFFRYLRTTLENNPLDDWGEYRWADLLVSIHWLYERTDEKWLLDLAELAIEQGFNWRDHFREHPFDQIAMGESGMKPHGVNNAMGIKSPGVRFRHSGDTADRDAVYRAIDVLDRFHGQVTGHFAACERLAGKHPSIGTELCVLVEYMYSLEHLVSVFGDPTFADRLERITYNALPAVFSPDMCSHQHTSQVNQVNCSIAKREWSNGLEPNIFGLDPNFGCCTANMHQGWPKFTSHLWMQTEDDGLATVAYAPSEVTTTVAEDVSVTIAEETAYPFDDSISLQIDVDTPIAFPLDLRIPSWSTNPTIRLPNGTTEDAEPSTYHRIEREWTTGDVLKLTFPAELETERRYQGSIVLSQGPLVFSLEIGEEWQPLNDEETFRDWEVYPTSLWNYGLDIDTENPEVTIEITTRPPGEIPFSPNEPPVEASVSGRVIPEWQLDQEWNWAGSLPQSPIRSREPVESLTLIPYGCTNLRITEFPLLTE